MVECNSTLTHSHLGWWGLIVKLDLERPDVDIAIFFYILFLLYQDTLMLSNPACDVISWLY